MRDHDDYAKSHPRMRSLFLKAMYPLWHREEMSPMPPAFQVDLSLAMPAGEGPGFVCIACQRAYADRPRFTMSMSVGTHTATVARCAVCAAQANYREYR